MRRSIALLVVGTLLLGASTLSAQQWQTNQPAATFTLDGLAGTGTTLATTSVTNGQEFTVAFDSTNTGLGWEVALTLLPPLPFGSGAVSTAGGQLFHMDLSDPALVYRNGGSAPSLQPFPGNFSYPVAISNAVSVSAQMVIVDAILADNIAISQAATLTVSAGTPQPGPTADDGTMTIPLGGALGGPSSITFYGTSYTQITVMSNGRVMPGGVGDGDFSPTLTEAVGDNPFIGFWTDFNPGLGGTITISAPTATQVRVDYQNINYFGESTPTSNFAILFESANGECAIDGLTGIMANPELGTSFVSGDPQFLGISGGAGYATDGGATTFSLGGSGTGTAGTDMIYDWYDSATQTGGLVTSLVAGTMNQLRFFPASLAGNTYVWTGL